MTAITLIAIGRAAFAALDDTRTRLVLTAGAERRDLMDETGKVFAFSQRSAVRSECAGRHHRSGGQGAERETKYYAVRHEPVVKVLP